MARISGVDLPRDKRIEIALTYIFGIGLHTSQQLLGRTQISPDTRVRDLTDDEVNRLREIIDKEMRVEGDLRREVSMNIKRLMDIGSYRGLRHRRGMPTRGQRTKTNARTRRGPARRGCTQEEIIDTGEARPPWGSPSDATRELVVGRASSRSFDVWRMTGQWLNGEEAEQGKGKTRIRRRDRKNIPRGQGLYSGHVQQHDCDPDRPRWECHRLVERRCQRLQGVAQEHALRRAGDRRAGGPTCDGARSAPGRRLRQGPGFRPRDGDPCAGSQLVCMVLSITDTTPIPHNGCRPPKRRRV